MSAAIAWDGVEAGRLVGTRGGRSRRHLRLVPTPAPVRVAPSRPMRPVATGFRLTRLGRLSITLFVAVTLCAGLALAYAAGPGAAAPAGSGERVVVVQSGQTLSGLAQAYLPERGIVNAISAIQVANGLSSDRLLAGQRLVIPAR